MIHKQRLLEGLRNTPADARVDHETPLLDRSLTTTALVAAQIITDETSWDAGEDVVWAEREAVGLVLGIAAHQKWFDPRRGKLDIGTLARKIDRVPETGAGGPGLARLKHLTTAVYNRKPLTARRYLVEFGKLQEGNDRLRLVLLAAQAAVVFGPDRERALAVVRQWQLAYRGGSSAQDPEWDRESQEG